MEGGRFSALGIGKNSSLYSIEKVQNTAIMGAESQAESKLSLKFDGFSNIGITAYMPNEYAHITGAMDYDSQDISSGDGIYLGYLDYIGITGEEYQELMEKEHLSEEENAELERKTIPILNLIVSIQHPLNKCLGNAETDRI